MGKGLSMRWALLIIFGIVAILNAGGATAAPAIEAYGQLPALDLVRLSPSGNRIAFVAVDGETRKLFIRKVGGDAMMVETVGTAKIRDIEWAGEDYAIVLGTVTLKVGDGLVDKWSRSSREEIPLILIVDIAQGKVTPMFDHDRLEMYMGEAIPLGARLIDGRWYEFIYTYNTRMGYCIYRVDLQTGAYTRLGDYEGTSYDYLIGPNGEVVARGRYDEDTHTWNLFVGGKGRQAVVQQKSELNLISLEGQGRSPGTAIVEETGEIKDTVSEYSIAEKSVPTALFEGLDVDQLLRDPQSHLLVGAELSRGQGVVILDANVQRRFDAVRRAFPGLQVKLISFASGFGKLVIFTDGGDDPGTYWLVDMTTGHAQDLMAAYPSIDAKDVGPTRMFSYNASDGMALEGVLTLPPGSQGKDMPLVVIPHGGPIDVYDWLGFDYWAQAFASRGYAVFQPNYRGSGGYGAPLRQAGFGQWGKKMLTDMSDGVQALAAAHIVDPKRVCIVGASYGGYAAQASVTILNGFYRCAASVSGISDVGATMSYEGGDSATSGGRYSQKKFGASFPGASSNADISPLRHADTADAPILLVHGKDDTRVPFVHSVSMNAALQKAGKTVSFVPLEGEDHFWSHEATRVKILQETVGFVEKYNPVH